MSDKNPYPPSGPQPPPYNEAQMGYPTQAPYPNQPPQPGFVTQTIITPQPQVGFPQYQGMPQHSYGCHTGYIPQSGFIPAQGNTIVTHTTQQPYMRLGPEPSTTTCPTCKVTMTTRLDYEPTSKTHLMALLLCVFGLFCCVCLPYCMNSCMNGNHYCSNCGTFLGTYVT